MKDLLVLRGIKTNWLTQGFGENKAMVKLNKWNRPIRPFIVKSIPSTGIPDGWTGFYTALGMKGHNSDDWMSWHGEPLYFSTKAKTAWYSLDASDQDGGIGVDVFSVSRIHIPVLPPETGVEARKDWEAHNHTIRVKFRGWHLLKAWKDEEVLLGELVGYCDNSGASSGSHLHGWAMKFVDDNDNTFDTNNGYYGCVDYRKIGAFENIFILDHLKQERKNKEAEIKSQIVEAETTLRSLYMQLLTLLQIQVFKLRKELKKVGGSFINNLK